MNRVIFLLLYALLSGNQALGDTIVRCSDLANHDFSRLLDAPTQIVDTAMISESKELPAHCQVNGYVSPAVGFSLVLPTNLEWNKKLFQLGCGGFCGSTDDAGGCDEPLRRGYASITSDNGHKSTITDGKWAFGNLTAEIDHAFRAPHVTSLAGKAIVQSYYGESPRRAYFMGSSTGGRQALMEAQRFPWDFDGIIAGVPSVNVPLIYMHLLWANRALVDTQGTPRLSPADIETIHKAVLAQCDLDDGLPDELIGDPRTCSFDPFQLLCSHLKKIRCLSAEQVDTVRKLYSGPVTSTGEQIYSSGVMKGSERTWLEYFWGAGKGNRWVPFDFAGDAFRYSAFRPAPGPEWSPHDFNFDRDYKRLGQSEALYAAINPDLRKFSAAGGKLIAYAGWDDAIGMPLPMVDYYETVERTMGGRETTQDFFRLFVIPGMAHVPDANGAFVVDWISYLEGWVERGEAPAAVRSACLRLSAGQSVPRERIVRAAITGVPDPALVSFTRPVYPYPTKAIYSGHGDPNEASSFIPADENNTVIKGRRRHQIRR